MPGFKMGRVTSDIKIALSDILREVKDPRVSKLLSIVKLDVSGDMSYAKVYVSFLQEEKAKEALKGLKSASGYLRRELGRALQLRYTPELVWEQDDSITYGAKMLKLINSLEINRDEEPDEE